MCAATDKYATKMSAQVYGKMLPYGSFAYALQRRNKKNVSEERLRQTSNHHIWCVQVKVSSFQGKSTQQNPVVQMDIKSVMTQVRLLVSLADWRNGWTLQSLMAKPADFRKLRDDFSIRSSCLRKEYDRSVNAHRPKKSALMLTHLTSAAPKLFNAPNLMKWCFF